MWSVPLVSSYRAIEKWYRDTGTQSYQNEDTLIEWIGEAINLLGLVTYLQQDVQEPVRLKVVNHKAKVPCGTLAVRAVYAGNKPLYNISRMSPYTAKESNQDLVYSFDYPCIIVPFKSGDIDVYITKTLTDEQGYPLIPEYPELLEYIIQYIEYKMNYIQYKQGKMQYYELRFHQANLESATTIARTAIILPSVEEFRASMDQFSSLSTNTEHLSNPWKNTNHR